MLFSRADIQNNGKLQWGITTYRLKPYIWLANFEVAFERSYYLMASELTGQKVHHHLFHQILLFSLSVWENVIAFITRKALNEPLR